MKRIIGISGYTLVTLTTLPIHLQQTSYAYQILSFKSINIILILFTPT